MKLQNNQSKKKIQNLLHFSSFKIIFKRNLKIVRSVYFKLNFSPAKILGSILISIKKTWEDFQILLNELNKILDINEFIAKREKKNTDNIEVELKRNFQKLLNYQQLHRSFNIFHDFCEISYERLNIQNCGVKRLLKLKKRNRPKNINYCKNLLLKKFNWQARPFQEKYLAITLHKLLQYNNNSYKAQISEKEFFFEKKLLIKYENQKQTRIRIRIGYNRFDLEFSNIFITLDTINCILKCFQESLDKQFNRYNSFSPIYYKNKCKFYINGHGESNYFHDLHDALLKAKKQVFIQGWFVTPQFYLKRPIEEYPQSRLDMIISQLAERNVQIYIILYNECKHLLPNASAYTQKILSYKNVKISRHPKGLKINFWSHHEKMVIIDNKYLFMGGLDICFGRYEVQGYPLTEPNPNQTLFYGQGFQNVRIKDDLKAKYYEKCVIDKKTQPRMPWRDQGIRMEGIIVKSMIEHFKEFWCYTNNCKNEKQPQSYDQFLKECANLDENNIEDKYLRNTIKKGKNFNNQNKNQLIQNIEYDDLDQEQLNDNDNKLDGCIQDPEDEQQHYESQFKQGFFSIQALRSASSWSIGKDQDCHEQSIQDAYIDCIKKSKKFIYIENQFFVSSIESEGVKNKIVEELAKRILKAIIKKEDFVVYIFLPLLPGFEGEIKKKNSWTLKIQLDLTQRTLYKNQDSLIKRIQEGYRKHIREYRKQRDINSEKRVLENLDEEVCNWKQYLKIFGLRNHCVINNKPVTEIIYIHSKIMIVDDRQVIIGSANINDRSMTGERDSELAVILQEEYLNYGVFGEQQFNVSKQIRQYRKDCMKSLFNIPNLNYDDPLSKQFINAIDKQTNINEKFYQDCFEVYPSNCFKTFEDIKDKPNYTIEESKIKLYQQQKNKVQGYVVWWPLKFLRDCKNGQIYTCSKIVNILKETGIFNQFNLHTKYSFKLQNPQIINNGYIISTKKKYRKK